MSFSWLVIKFNAGAPLPEIEANQFAASRSVSESKVRFPFSAGFVAKVAVIDDVVRPFHLGRRGLAPDPDALYATFELRNTQSLGRAFVAGKFLGQNLLIDAVLAHVADV